MGAQHYTVLLLPDLEGKGYTVTVPLLPGCITEGDTLGEALANAREVLDLWIDHLRECGEPVPMEPMPATVIERALAEARATMQDCLEDLQAGGEPTPAEPPVPMLATIDLTAEHAPVL